MKKYFREQYKNDKNLKFYTDFVNNNQQQIVQNEYRIWLSANR